MQVVVISIDDLRRLIAEAIAEALARAQEPAPSEWLDDAEAAELLGYVPAYLRQAIKRYRIPHHRVGRGYRFRRSEIEQWIRDRGMP